MKRQQKRQHMRRELKFECLKQAITDAETLLNGGYVKSGNWSLAQICAHLRMTIEKNMEGYPAWMVILGYPLRPILRVFALPNFLAGKSPAGIPTAGMFVPPNDLDDVDELGKWKECVQRFLAMEGPMHAHPGFGNMSNEDFNRFHAAHAAHHLSFLRPEKSPAS